jgi:hypothetical protein
LCRASTSLIAVLEGVVGRDKPGHDKANERIGRAKKAAEILVFADLGA